MNNLHRELAPICAAAWADLENEAGRTFRRHVAGRRIVDVAGPDGVLLSAVGTGHLQHVDSHSEGVIARIRRSQPVVELRVPFTVDRQQVDDVERGARDADWQPVKDAARQIAFAEDRAIFEGYGAAGITGLRAAATNPAVALPPHVRDYPTAIGQAMTALRLAGVNGPYRLALGADAYTAVSEAADQGYPIQEHITRMVGSEHIWAPAIDGAFLLSTRGGDFELHLGQDVSIGYLAHDAASVQLYFQETLTFMVYAGEAAVALSAPDPA
ncbi:putative 29 kDa antigen CFP29 (Bacteriocin CFP29) [Acrocarpospora corrugata]|uniref:Type 1 encapsulin shell protein n=1 Tax=Acrocarpospora corrugata TaxID=35763 RepID=A0A5M3VNR4_9ACTN|nr:family 1 encapsulin nanocompartment shell protein [Acrocarpospora corrugata]GER98163.1 putative 29 kDa antigen CFP29 (Bacteriocin CFP29) [Acrocarpospora corrugata]